LVCLHFSIICGALSMPRNRAPKPSPAQVQKSSKRFLAVTSYDAVLLQ
jgi:hypothetical protein